MDNLGRQKPCSKDQDPWTSDRDPLVKPAELVSAFIIKNVLWRHFRPLKPRHAKILPLADFPTSNLDIQYC